MPPRGRPRSFDRDDALARIMDVFWTKGYEGAHLNDLIAAIGISPPSFYAAFGSKEAAFKEAVDLYIATVGAGKMTPLETAETARDGIRQMLEGSIDIALSGKSGGCFLIMGAINPLPENQPVLEYLMQARRRTETLIHACLQRGVQTGEFQQDTDVDQLAAFYHGILQAISFQARDGATRAQLTSLISPAMAALK